MKSYRPSLASAHREMNLYSVQHSARGKIGKRVRKGANQDNTGQRESPYISSRMLKRSSPYSSTILEAYTGNTHKVKAADLDGRQRRLGPITFRRKVDDVAYVGEAIGENYTQHSYYNRLSGHCDLDRAKLNMVVNELDLARSSEQNDSDNDASSVASCSVNTMWADKFSNCCFAVPYQARELDSNEAESFCRALDAEENCSRSLGENVEVSIHMLELQAYRCTLEALYASGPLSWEKELLLTNLRIMLHISNDEHLSELKNLIVR